MGPIRKFVAWALAAALLAACTASFTYNRLDWLIPWYVDGYVDLTRDQRRLLRQHLEPRLEWHRQEELARYIALLDRIEGDLEGPVEAGTVRAWIDEFIAAIERVEETLLSVALEFGTAVSDEQMREFVDNLWEKQREYEDEFLGRSDQEYHRDNYENLEELLDRFLGRLSEGQKSILRQAAESLTRFDGVWLEERAAWLRTLEPLLRREAGWEAAVEQAYAQRGARRTEAYRSILEENTEIVARAIADVLAAMSEKQRAHAGEEIADWRRRLQKLIARSDR